VPEKVSSITLVNSTKVKVQFSGVVAQFEVIRSTDCEITCTGTCPGYTIDNGKGCKLTLPRKGANEVMIVSSQSTGTMLTLRPESDAQGDESKEVVYEIKESAPSNTDHKDSKNASTTAATTTTADSSTSATAGSNSAQQTANAAATTTAAVQPQFMTKFSNGAFQTAAIVREGIGYVSMN